MPSSTTKQAKVMSAIDHGWRPTHGSVAKIPLSVAHEFHQADAGSKYGAKSKKSFAANIHGMLKSRRSK